MQIRDLSTDINFLIWICSQFAYLHLSSPTLILLIQMCTISPTYGYDLGRAFKTDFGYDNMGMTVIPSVSANKHSAS